MASTFKNLAIDFRELSSTLPERANRAKQVAASTINNDLLQITPVDTGLAVSNWIVTLDTPSTETRSAFIPAKEGYSKQTKGVKNWTHRGDPESTRQANIAPASELARATIESAAPGQPICIANNLDYIQLLDTPPGHSSQAVKFVDRAIILGREIASRVTITD